MIECNTKDIKTAAEVMRAGEMILLSGNVFTARDAAHKKLFELLDSGEALPFDLDGAIIYYTGPTPAPDHLPVGSCGPTTSSRMDGFSSRLLDLGLSAMIGKGERNAEVCKAIIRNKAVYLCAIGGAGALMASHVTKAKELAFHDLGCESVKQLTVENLPLIVAIDCHGGNIFLDRSQAEECDA